MIVNAPTVPTVPYPVQGGTITERQTLSVDIMAAGMPERLKAMEKERTLVFLDFANIAAGSGPFGHMDFGALLDYLAEDRFLVDAYAYVPIDPRRPEARRNMIRALQMDHWMVYQKMGKIAGDSYKSNVDVEMCIDIMRSAQVIKPDIIVLCSGDGDFLPVIRELRKMGIRTEVASFETSADASLAYEASGFISLDVWLEQLRPRESYVKADNLDFAGSGFDDDDEPDNTAEACQLAK